MHTANMLPCVSLFQKEKNVTANTLAPDALAHHSTAAIFLVAATANKHASSKNSETASTKTGKASK
ncbi:MAG: hypothetical protein LBR89_04415 [Holosporales bacterium]|nr:hypothetical protein [Holosporales bacterium]